jgi:nicotinate-nucleotide adenylyltransferase
VTAARAIGAIGIFGGSFDPPHLAHLALARAALEQLALDELRWLPAGAPWQKQRDGRTLADGAHRVAMTRLLVAGEPRFVVDERELHRAGPSYTVDTLRELRAEHPAARLWLVIGQDQYARLDTWHEWREILPLASLAVAARDGCGVIAPPAVAAVPHVVQVLALAPMPHAATEARRLAARGADTAALVGTAVAQYITRHSLYREAPASHDRTN